jgi:hypothetical protein
MPGRTSLAELSSRAFLISNRDLTCHYIIQFLIGRISRPTQRCSFQKRSEFFRDWVQIPASLSNLVGVEVHTRYVSQPIPSARTAISLARKGSRCDQTLWASRPRVSFLASTIPTIFPCTQSA